MCWTYQIQYQRCEHTRPTTEFCGDSHMSRSTGLRRDCGKHKAYLSSKRVAALRADGVCGGSGCALSSLYERSFDWSARCDRCWRLRKTMRVYYDESGWRYHSVCRDCTYSYEE